MSRKDKRPESQKHEDPTEISDKATDRTIFDDQFTGGQTTGNAEAGVSAGQSKNQGNYTQMGQHADRRP
ncbi:MAG: hypothetical protein M3Q29_15100 [Chloroflexota bacterium]|nr:hypothetical protein [Chloroflexota bacterium]